MSRMESFSISETEEVKQQRLEMEKLADELHSELVVGYKPHKLKESIFVEFFLPRILGEVEDEDNGWLGMWRNVAGTIAAPVEVISDHSGEVLFRVPPLLQSSKLNVRGNPYSLKDVIQDYNMMKDNPVQNSKGYINQRLSETLGEVANSIDLSEEVAQWENILKRYGRLGGEDVKGESTTSEGEDISDLLIW